MDTVKLTIDEHEITVSKGKTVIQAAADAGISIPHYCYHPKLTIAGNCRMCLVEIEKMPKLQIACNTQATEGMVVRTQSQKVLDARRAVMEFLLINHPLDCPICDQAGECWLQDYYMNHDLMSSRFQEHKVHNQKRHIFGPHVIFDAERCIKCTRCVRFLQEVTHTEELTILNRGDQATISLFPDKVLDNPLAANVNDICPVGALTDRDFRFKVRVWFLTSTPSICPGCSTGCNIQVETYQNRVSRFKPRINEEVNSHWICDEGRYCFHSLTDGERVDSPLIRQEGGLVATDWETALRTIFAGLSGTDPIAGLISGRNTNEEAFLFARLLNQLSPRAATEVFYRERALSDTARILMSPDRSPNFRGARDMGIGADGGMEVWLQRLIRNEFSSLYLVGEDLLSPSDASSDILNALKKLPFLVVQDAYLSASARLAHVVLPGSNFAEKDGTYTNRKGRVQRVQAALVAPPRVLPDWAVFSRLLAEAGVQASYRSAEEIFQQIAAEMTAYRALTYATLGESGAQLGS